MFSKFFKRGKKSFKDAESQPILEPHAHTSNASSQWEGCGDARGFNFDCRKPPSATDHRQFNGQTMSNSHQMNKSGPWMQSTRNAQNQFHMEIDDDLRQGQRPMNKHQYGSRQPSEQRMVNSIDSLSTGIQTSPLVGFVLSKEDAKTFAAKEGGAGGARCVLGFTLRDSPFSYINVSLWGKPDSVNSCARSFSVGDIVEVAGCNVKEKQAHDDKYRPWTTSQYQVVVNDSHGSINIYMGPMLDEYTRLAHMPLQTPGPVYKLSEIVNNINNLNNDLISFTAAVRSVQAARSVTSKTSGRKMHLREVKLFDQQVPLFHLILWSNEMISFSEHWQPNETVLSAVDLRVSYDHYKKGVVASASSKSIFIINPDTREGAALYQFAQTVTWPDDETDKPMALQSVDLSTINTEYNVYEFTRMCDDIPPDGFEHGIIYGFLSHFDVDGSLDNVLSGKCCECGKMLSSLISGKCSSYDCMSSDIVDLREEDIFYRIRVEISDHTGTLSNCKLVAEEACKMLQCKAIEFIQLDDEQRTIKKWKYLFERCRFAVKAYRLGTSAVSLVVLGSTKLSCQDHIKHLR